MFHRVKLENQDENQTEQGAASEATESSNETTQSESGSYSYSKEPASDASSEQASVETKADDLDIPPVPAGYQSAQQTSPTSSGSGFGNKPYQAPTYSGPSSSSSAPDMGTDNDRRLTIGRGITMSGEIESCDYLLVEGTVEAALKGANALNIAESGTFYGVVEIEEAVIAGRFEGEIMVNGRLTIKSSGVITGSISYKELEVEAGAVIDGSLSPVASSEADEKAAPAQKTKAKAKSPKMKAPQAPANSDGELFANEKVTAAE